jgi:glycerophosphoryl diester phosphodiesterase
MTIRLAQSISLRRKMNLRRLDRPAVFLFLASVLIFAALWLIPETGLSMSESPETARAAHKPLLVAHRGASGYAPEHTLAAYGLAIEQGADFVEQDLQLTKDGHFVCLHDPELSRTTNVAEVFADRATMRDPEETGEPHRGYYTVDFTLAEIKQLDAGSWFNRANAFAANPVYAGQRVPTLEETIKFVGNRAGLYIELKHYPFYKNLGFDAAEKLAAMLKAHGFNRAGERERILIQSFSKQCLLRMREVAPEYRRVQLLPMEDAERKQDSAKVTPALAKEIAAYAQGAGPNKAMLKAASDVAIFHAAKLLVHPYTFRGPTLAGARKPLDEPQPNGSTVREAVIADIKRYAGFGIDGGFTDYPALWREAFAAQAKQPDKK